MRKFGEGFWTIWTLIVVVAICAGAAPAFSQQPAPPRDCTARHAGNK